jgi:pilus assembly protein Flp/PilA
MLDLTTYLHLPAFVIFFNREELTGMPALSESGATAVEYGLIAALIALAAVTVLSTVGHNLSTTFNTVAMKL